MRTSLWPTSWARPRVWSEGPEPVRFAVSDDGEVILPPDRGQLMRVVVAGHEGSMDSEQLAWQSYSIAAADAQLAVDHDRERGVQDPHTGLMKPRYSGERLGLVTLFSRLPLLGERKKRDDVVREYVEWCNAWGSPGLFAFLYEVAGYRRGREYVRDKRSGTLLTDEEFYGRHPEADLGDERFREPVPVEWFSREVALLRHALTLCAAAAGLGDVDKAEVQEADRVLGAELTYAGQGLRRGIPDYDQGANRNAADDVLARWLWVHSSGSRLVFSRDYREGGRPTLVWSFDSFMGALYHLLQEDLTAGQLIRRCADPKCRVFFRPDRDGKYHDLKCRTRVRLAAARARKKAEAAASQDGPGDERPPGHEQEEER